MAPRGQTATISSEINVCIAQRVSCKDLLLVYYTNTNNKKSAIQSSGFFLFQTVRLQPIYLLPWVYRNYFIMNRVVNFDQGLVTGLQLKLQ